MKQEFLKEPGVLKVAASSRVPGEWKNITEVYVKSRNQIQDSVLSYYMCFDEDMIDTYNFKILNGNNFSGNRVLDSTALIINESAIIELGLEKNPIGAKIQLSRRPEIEFTVIGVINNFNYQSLHSRVAPLVIGYWNAPIRPIDYFSIKVSGTNRKQIIQQLTKVHNQFDAFTPIEYHYLDTQIDQFYHNEAQANKIFRFGSGLIIFIACLGLFGLASFMIEKRTKEIGIRKVLGASTGGLYILISSSFLKQIVIAWLIAAPFSYLAMNSWLGLFTYKISMNIWVILLAGAIALIVALITISYRSLIASNSKPVNVLKYE